jgi:hypothetical protein
MKLADLMRKSVSMVLANAKAAKVANDGQESHEPLAGLATLALANPADQTRVCAWLDFINEMDPVLIAETLQRCETDPEALRYFLWRSQEVPTPAIDPDKADALECGQTDCRDCANYRGPESVCGARRCPTPQTLYRRCELFKETNQPARKTK